MEDTVRAQLRRGRFRLIVQSSLSAGVWSVLAGLCVMLVGKIAAPKLVLWPVLLGFALLAVATAVLRWRSFAQVALELDWRGSTKDRFVSALALDEGGDFESAAKREIQAYVAGLKISEIVRWRIPLWQSALWLLPLGGLFLLNVSRERTLARHDPERKEALALIQKAEQLAAGPGEVDEQVRKDLEDAKEQLADSAEPLRDALRALADLEQKLATASASNLNADEAAVLAKALQAEAPQAAGQLQGGNQSEAAREIEALDPETVAKALEDAARHVESRRMQELAQKEASEAQKQLVRMMRSQDGPGDGDSARKRMLTNLRNAKGDGDESFESQKGDPSDGQSGDSPNGEEKPDPSLADNAPPGGGPGSEDDKGKGKELGGEKEIAQEKTGTEDFIFGQLGSGASLVETLRAAGNDDPQALRAWQAAYEKAEAAAREAVDREEIPSGSRLLVRRYFESIRPKE